MESLKEFPKESLKEPLRESLMELLMESLMGFLMEYAKVSQRALPKRYLGESPKVFAAQSLMVPPPSYMRQVVSQTTPVLPRPVPSVACI